MYVSQGRLGTCVGVPVGSYSYRGTKYSPQSSKTHRVVASGEKNNNNYLSRISIILRSKHLNQKLMT